jgi:hypothetical protein
MFRRISKYVREFLGISCSERDRINPESVLASQQEKLLEQLSHYNRSLAASARLCDVLKEQIKGIEERERSLRAALDSQIQNGGPEDAAHELALRWQSLRDESAGLGEQLQQAEATCGQITLARDTAIQTAQKKMEELRGMLSEQQLRKAITEAIDRARIPQ